MERVGLTLPLTPLTLLASPPPPPPPCIYSPWLLNPYFLLLDHDSSEKNNNYCINIIILFCFLLCLATINRITHENTYTILTKSSSTYEYYHFYTFGTTSTVYALLMSEYFRSTSYFLAIKYRSNS